MNLQLLKYCLQDTTESFTEYYTLILTLCRKYDPYIPNPHIANWLKAGMELELYETLRSENFTTSQALFLLARRLELDNAVFLLVDVRYLLLQSLLCHILIYQSLIINLIHPCHLHHHIHYL